MSIGWWVVNLGAASLVLAFALAIYATIASTWGAMRQEPRWIDSARYALGIVFILLTASSLSLLYLLANLHFEVAYVHSVTNSPMPMYLRLTAWWGGQAGSLLFWSWLMALYASTVAWRDWSRDREFLPWVIMVTGLTLAFFLFLTTVLENPFRRLWALPTGEVVEALLPPRGAQLFVPPEGRGLNPLLRHPGMIAHPPALYLGFVGFVIPFAFAVAALMTRRTDDRWIRLTRRWALVAWLFLSLGLVLGGRWAYDVLGWGGYWGWDPVEIAAFMPWLTGTAFLHSVMIQERRNMLKHWNMVLIILTYSLVIFGTFLTRSGVLSSVHSFAQSAIGPAFFIFIASTFLASTALLIWRWNDLKSVRPIRSLLSREAMFLYVNLLFLSILAVCFWGVIYPLLSELFVGEKVTMGPPYYERATGPLFAALLLLMGIGPLAAWGRTQVKQLGRALWLPALVTVGVVVVLAWRGLRSPGALLGFALAAWAAAVTLLEFWRGARARQKAVKEPFPVALARLIVRNPRRFGGYIIHLGVVFMAIGIVGIEFLQYETQRTLRAGERLQIKEYTVEYKELQVFNTNDGRRVARAILNVYKDGQQVATIYPRQDFYILEQQPMTIPGVYSTWEKDLYALLVFWRPITTEGATFKFYYNPLVRWMWFGAWVFVVGTLVALWPHPAPGRVRVTVPKGARPVSAGD